MSSTDSLPSFPNIPAWRDAGLRYYSFARFLRQRFGRKIWKVSLDAGFDCPNRDGTSGSAGCVFCNPQSFSPSRRSTCRSISGQIAHGVERLRRRYRADRFLAYFQPATNTYGPLGHLRRVYTEAISHPHVVGLVVGTRPDCVGDDVLDLLAELAEQTWVLLEYGLQTIHDRSLDWLGRGHHYDAFLDAVERTGRRNLPFGVHLILGLPGESREDLLATARELARIRPTSAKLHNLHVVKDTRLADAWSAGELKLPRREEYVDWVVDFLEELPPDCAVDRLSGDAPPEYLLAPEWSADKSAVRAAVEAELERRDTWQGRNYSGDD